ncbi:MAG: hypothetical protein R2748_10630 [Bryobacterales bacterium]
MRIHIEPEETQERLGRPVTVSLSCHAALFLLILVWAWLEPPPLQLGDPEGNAGSAVSVNVVQGIPIPSRNAPPNPVANDVKHDVPAPPEPEKKVEPEPAPEPEAVPIEPPKPKPQPKKEPPKEATPPKKSEPEKKENQVTSTTGPAATSPLFNQPQAGGAGVGMGAATPSALDLAGTPRLCSADSPKSGEDARSSDRRHLQAGRRPVYDPKKWRDRRHSRGRVQRKSLLRLLGAPRRSVHQSVSRPPPALRRSSIPVEMTFRKN